ncbi:DNA-binding protein [Sulfurimonas sp. HSL-1656]|uniref:helix-turn-helix transcriptional regulator n=1 Tax=Thiomicrolovo subterrani TaxID=3131934 RepID=UPI0031F87134
MELSLEHLELIPVLLKKIDALSKRLESSSEKRWMSVAETADYLSYSRDRIYKIKDEHFIEGVHFHNRTGKILFDRVAIDSWVVGKDDRETDYTQRQVVDNVLSSIKEI